MAPSCLFPFPEYILQLSQCKLPFGIRKKISLFKKDKTNQFTLRFMWLCSIDISIR